MLCQEWGLDHKVHASIILWVSFMVLGIYSGCQFVITSKDYGTQAGDWPIICFDLDPRNVLHYSCSVVFCCSLLPICYNHILQGYLTGTRAIISSIIMRNSWDCLIFIMWILIWYDNTFISNQPTDFTKLWLFSVEDWWKTGMDFYVTSN